MTSLRALSAEGGIDYDQAMERFGENEALYLRLSAKFLNDPHFLALEKALGENDTEAAQREVHSLKGVAGNLSFFELYETACTINDALLGNEDETARSLMPTLREEYERVCKVLRDAQA